jgi:hypothetical protein
MIQSMAEVIFVKIVTTGAPSPIQSMAAKQHYKQAQPPKLSA